MSKRTTNNSRSKEESLEVGETKSSENMDELNKESEAIQAAIESAEKLKRDLRCEELMPKNESYIMIDLANITSLGIFIDFFPFFLNTFFYVHEFRCHLSKFLRNFCIFSSSLLRFLSKNAFRTHNTRTMTFLHPFDAHILPFRLQRTRSRPTSSLLLIIIDIFIILLISL